MKAALERKVRLRPGPEFSRFELPGRELAERLLTSTYYDTDDLRLAAGSATLRLQASDGGDPVVWQLKLRRRAGQLELEWDAVDLDAGVPEDVAGLVFAHTRGRPLIAVATLRTRRSGVMVQEAGLDVAEVVLDAVDVVDGGQTVESFEEIEVDVVEGDGRALRKLERRLRRAGAVDPDGRPKVMQALDAPLRGRPFPDAGDDAAGCLTTALRRNFRDVLDHDPGTRLGADPEELHDHRVAIRRLRELLRAGRPLVDRTWADGLRDALRPVGKALANVRDLDVVVADLEDQAASLGDMERAGSTDVLELVRKRRDRAHAELVTALSEAWYVSLLNRLEIAVAEPRLARGGSVTKVVRKQHRRSRRLVRHLPEHPSDAQLHRVRKAVKRARYAAELADAAGVSGMRRYVKRAKAVQDVLGEHQDAAVAAEVLGSVDGDLHRPMAHMAVAALVDVQQSRKHAARRAFRSAWRRLDKLLMAPA
jgi:CHAD domain-containing protein